MRDRTIQYLVGAGSPTTIAKNKQSPKPALPSQDLHSHYPVRAGSPTTIANNRQSHKPALPSRDSHSHFTNKFAVHLFGWWGGGGFLRLLIFVMNVGEPAPTRIVVDLLDTILIANI